MQTVSFYRSFTCQNIPLPFPSPKEQQKAKSATGRTEIKAMPQELCCFFPGLVSCREGLQSWQDPSSGHPSAAQEHPRGGEDPAPPEGEVSLPWARFDFQSQGNARAFERNLQAKGKAWGGKIGTTIRDLYFQLHFPALMSSYFQGIQIMQSRCFSGYHFKDSFFFFSGRK